jgi:hypothetical protein
MCLVFLTIITYFIFFHSTEIFTEVKNFLVNFWADNLSRDLAITYLVRIRLLVVSVVVVYFIAS